MATERVHLPEQLRAWALQVPRLAWVTSRAFAGDRWPRWVGDLWAIPPAVALYLPVVAAWALGGGRIATNADRTALVGVSVSRRDALPLVGVGVPWILVLVGAFNAAADGILALPRTPTQDVVVLTAVLALTMLVVAPLAVQVWALFWRLRADGAAGADRYVVQLRRDGHTAWAIGPWATWPPHRKAGRKLVDQLLPQVPAHVWLVAVARDESVAGLLDERGFLTPAAAGLLRVRPPAGRTPPSPQPRRRPVTRRQPRPEPADQVGRSNR